MAPKKVDKASKRKEIALACFDLISKVGIRNLTVAEVAKQAGIGKGTVYEYFENKYDIIFEIINHHVNGHISEFNEKLKDIQTSREKIFIYFEFAVNEDENQRCDIDGYKDYISVSLSENAPEMLAFNQSISTRFRKILSEIIEDGICNNELIDESRNFIDAFLSYEKGLFLRRVMNTDLNAKKECETFINTLFDLIEVKK